MSELKKLSTLVALVASVKAGPTNGINVAMTATDKSLKWSMYAAESLCQGIDAAANAMNGYVRGACV